jgi:YjjG family noncanonical pyrimidine nucleotidase
MKYTTILIDADDTLLDFKRAEHDALTKTLESFSIEPSDLVTSVYSEINDGYWKLLEKGGITKEALRVRRFEDLCTHFGFNKNAERMASIYEKTLGTMTYLLNGALELCRDLSSRYRLYIVTNGIKDVQMGRLYNSEIKDLFITAFVSEEMGSEKPRVEYFDAVAERIPEFDKEKTIIIGDSLSSDIKGGINYGIDTCWYNPKNKAAPKDMEITYIVNSFDDIRKLLLE